METLKDIYYDPKTGLVSLQKLYKKLDKKIPLSQLKEFLKTQETEQLMRQTPQQKGYKPIVVYSANDQWQIDLIDISKYSKWNSGVKYLMGIVDVFSRKALVVPLQSKSETASSLGFILKNHKPILIQTDNGTEFLNKKFQKLLKSHSIRHTTVAVGDHRRQGIVERFNRTIERLIAKYQESRRTNRYIEVLDDLVFNYNNTYHRIIRDTPENRFNSNPNQGIIYRNNFTPDINKGDLVRILINKTTFQKGYENTYSKQVYKVSDGNHYTYRLTELQGKLLPKSFQYYDLLKVYKIESYTDSASKRDSPPTNKEKKDKRELEDLQEHTMPKKRKVRFEGNYFLGVKNKQMEIKDYKEYLQMIKQWDQYSTEEQE
jgi:transposase InsO family protein